MGALMRGYDWNTHPLGNPAHWPQSLKTNIRLLLHSGFPMFVWWSDEFYMFHNDAYLPALGKKHPKALGARAADAWAEIWHQVGVIAADIMKDGTTFYAENLQLFLDRKDFKEETYWTFSYSPAFDDKGEVAGIFCACYEVTSHVIGQRRLKTLKDISEALALTENLEQTCQTACDIFHTNPRDIPFNLIYLLNEAGTEARRMGKAGDIDAYAGQEILDLTKLRAVPDSPLAKVLRTRQTEIIPRSAIADLLQAARVAPADQEQAVILPILKPGQNQLIGIYISGINPQLEYDADYQNFHMLLTGHIATSITSVQVREAALKQRESLNEMFQQAPVGITILRGPNYNIELANPGVCEIWGRRQEDILGMPVLDALPEVREQGIKELLDQVYTTGIPYIAHELPIVLDRKGKLEEVYLNFVYQPVRNALGTVTGIIAVAIDISEQVAARRETEVINRELLAINADLDNFVYAASHDLKAPISNIEGLMLAMMDHLSDETRASEVVQQLTVLIYSSIERFKKALLDLTEVAKIQREAGEDVTYVDLAEVVTQVALDFEPVIRESGATIVTEMSQGTNIQFSAKNIRSVVYNLISNALKYKSPDRKPHIVVATEMTPGHLILSVTDNGLGIDMANEVKIFSMFKRLHDHVEGSGIGLYIVKRIVENAGGRIEVESQLGVGSTFKIYFKH
ncbi:hypothetical protein OB13_08785 [Pontibacter sp. HJ8]